jgi:ornithine cyclodeaminase/alanine dehydrogenase-like protein (mu-crystallin family)
LPLVRELDEIQVCSREFDHAERLAGQCPKARAQRNLEDAVRCSDMVCLATDSPTPVIEAEWVKPGAHVSSVGYNPPQGELPPKLAREQRLFVETSDAFASPPVGCAELKDIDASHGTPLGDVVNNPRKGRQNPQEITVFKAMGIAMEDMAAANLVYRNALRSGVTSHIDW